MQISKMANRARILSMLVVGTVLLALLSGPISQKVSAASGAITNGDFESGDLTGWAVGGSGAQIEVLRADDFVPEISAPEGRCFLLLSTGPGEVNLDSGSDLDGNGVPDYDSAALSQTFSLSADQIPATLSFRWSFLTAEVGGNDDFFSVTLNGQRILAGSTPAAPFFVSLFSDAPLLDDTPYTVASPGATVDSSFYGGRCSFQDFSYVISSPGTYALEFIVADQEDRFFDSGLLIDAIRLTVPSQTPPGPGGIPPTPTSTPAPTPTPSQMPPTPTQTLTPTLTPTQTPTQTPASTVTPSTPSPTPSTPTPTPATGLNWALTGGIIAAALLVVGLLIYFFKRRRATL